MTIPVVTIDANGITVPDYNSILTALKNVYFSIYGSDADLDADAQDGELLADFAQAMYDLNQAVAACYNSFSPVTAQGAGLSSNVKLNGIRRQSSSQSTATVTITGVAQTPIINGIVGDNLNLGTQWALPASVTIPDSGTIDVLATCTVVGANAAAPTTLTVILTPTLGWQTVNNAGAATAGAPIEVDATLRRRQARSVALPAQTVLESIYAELANVAGVERLMVFENDTDATDGNGIPSHSICAVVEGGSSTDIANAIALKKAPGTGTFGTTSVIVLDPRGVPSTIKYFVLAEVTITVQIDIKVLGGYVAGTSDVIKAAVAAFITSFDIGEDSYLSRLYTPANLGGVGVGATFFVNAIRQARSGSPAVQDVVMAFNEAAVCAVSNITVAVVP